MANYVVEVKLEASGEIVCTPEDSEVKRGDTIQWISKQGPHTGNFPGGSPLDRADWSGPKGQLSAARTVTGRDGTYKYAITLQTGGTTHVKDPRVIVKG